MVPLQPHQACFVGPKSPRALLAAALIGLSAPAAARPQDEPGAPSPADGPAYVISSFILQYVRDHPQLPPADSLMQIEIPLGQTEQGFVALRSDDDATPLVPLRLIDLPDRETQVFFASAVQIVLERIRDDLVGRGLMGVYVAPNPFEIDELGRDLRPQSRRSLTILITTGIVTEIRTLASGDRIRDPQARINHPLHQRILHRSPVRPESGGDAPPRDLLDRDELDEYLYFLGRHPGRRVDASLGPAEAPGGVALDYIVTENPPLVPYLQFSNTGTRQTDYWRERAGFFHTQLTNSDDVLSVDFITAGFDETNALVASYERPFPGNDRLRWRVHGSWSEYTASDVGFFGDEFTGDSWLIGIDLIATIHQQRELFIDLVGGVRYEDVHVDNQAVLVEGQEQFLIPSVGLRLERRSEWFNTEALVQIEGQSGDLTGVDEAELSALGRTLPDDDWLILQWSVAHSVYLEPLLDRAGWEDPATPRDSTLAHEVAAGFRGQYAFDRRLIPQAEGVVGGLYTVRGYPESIAAGDTTVIGSLEYRLHLPRLFDLETEPRILFGRPFRFAPQYVYGAPDWDLVGKAFLDAGRTITSDPLDFEEDQTLLGTGIGLELQYRRNLNLRLDWGFALEELESADVNAGSNRLHVVATFLF
jgi:hemolysin activation/secretion protein